MEVNTNQVDGSNVDIIQSALEQSSLSLEESSDSLELGIDITLNLMDGESVAVPFCSSPSLQENVHKENLHHAYSVLINTTAKIITAYCILYVFAN